MIFLEVYLRTYAKLPIFEYLLLKANIFAHTSRVTEETYNFADSKNYFSWEEFYTAYLIEKSADTIYRYNKKKLNTAYLTVKNRKRIMEQLPKQIIRAQEKIGGTPCWKEDPLQAQTWNV